VTARSPSGCRAGSVIAVDGSRAMVEEARRRLPGSVDVREADLLELGSPRPSTRSSPRPTFHWIGDHDRLFARLQRRAEARRPARRAVRRRGQRGGGQGRRLRARPPRAVRRAPGGWPGDWNFQSPAATEDAARPLGYTDVWTWETRVAVDVDDVAGYLGAICLGSFLERLPRRCTSRSSTRGRRSSARR
jgi:trans-aconitate 2-methyltransferase